MIGGQELTHPTAHGYTNFYEPFLMLIPEFHTCDLEYTGFC